MCLQKIELIALAAMRTIDREVKFLKRRILSLFATLIILVSIGGVVSVLGAASHVNPGGVSKSTLKTDVCPYVGCKCNHVYHYADCYYASLIRPDLRVCFTSPCDAQAAGYTPCEHCHPPVC